MRTVQRALAATVAMATSVAVLHAPTAGAQAASPPALGPAGTATVHGDAASTDTLPGRGPGANSAITSSLTGATCSTVFIGSDGMPVALCTSYVGMNPPTPLAPTVKLFHPDTADVLAEVQLAKGALLGGVYGYLDDRDRVVVADGNRRLLAVGHERTAEGPWRMTVEVLADLSPAVPEGDAVTGLMPAFDGRVWFATSNGVVGTVRPAGAGLEGGDGSRYDDDNDPGLRFLALPAGERITNGLTVRPGGASVITTRALYEIDSEADGLPVVRWRHGYEVGPGRKPGLLAYGSGTTPTYFGPDDGLIAITDDSEPPDLIVLRQTDGSEVCRMPAFATTLDPSTAAADGVLLDGPAATENSIIAFGDALVLVNTYGFEYPPFAVDGPAVPPSAPYTGGMTRIDVDVNGSGADGTCSRAWTSLARTASLPKLTTGDGQIHAMAYGPAAADAAFGPAGSQVGPLPGQELLDLGLAQKVGPVFATSTDIETGQEVMRTFMGHAPLDEPMELTGTLASRGDAPGVMWQPTLTRMLRIGPA
ncbi:hypothetical protein [uncultured Dietzia sp.]|uniref:hypothetical protein n=1 Tax=uncultured Dietzia sp. TaxID=395519 RepID=UPI0025E56F2B|nr:hypothetical protein [uncultured Dietzia sp.]